MSDAPDQNPAEGGQQTQTPAPPSAPPPPPPPPPPPTAAERGGMRALFMSLGGFLALFVPIFGAALVGLGLLIAGVVTGVRARRRARRILARAPGAIAGIVIGVLGLLLTAAGLVVGAMIAQEFSDYQKCHTSALTITDKQTCQDRYFPAIEHKLHLPDGFLKRYSVM
jgi:hypothetical protein